MRFRVNRLMDQTFTRETHVNFELSKSWASAVVGRLIYMSFHVKQEILSLALIPAFRFK